MIMQINQKRAWITNASSDSLLCFFSSAGLRINTLSPKSVFGNGMPHNSYYNSLWRSLLSQNWIRVDWKSKKAFLVELSPLFDSEDNSKIINIIFFSMTKSPPWQSGKIVIVTAMGVAHSFIEVFRMLTEVNFLRRPQWMNMIIFGPVLESMSISRWYILYEL